MRGGWKNWKRKRGTKVVRKDSLGIEKFFLGTRKRAR